MKFFTRTETVVPGWILPCLKLLLTASMALLCLGTVVPGNLASQKRKGKTGSGVYCATPSLNDTSNPSNNSLKSELNLFLKVDTLCPDKDPPRGNPATPPKTWHRRQ